MESDEQCVDVDLARRRMSLWSTPNVVTRFIQTSRSSRLRIIIATKSVSPCNPYTVFKEVLLHIKYKVDYISRAFR